MKTVDQVITRFRRHYPGCDASTALDLFQTAYKRLLDRAEFRTADVTFSSIVAGQREYDWAEADLRVYGVTWYDSATSSRALRPTSEDALADWRADWRDQKQLGTPIAITSASSATPIVVTTTTPHGLLASNNGTALNRVYVSGVATNTAANGGWFAQVSGASTFALFVDQALTVPVAGIASGSGGTVQQVMDLNGDPCSFYVTSRPSGSTAKLVLGFDVAPSATTAGGYPYALCHCEEHVAISGSTTIPFSLLDEMYFVYAMCEFWAYEEDASKASLWERKRIQEESIQIEHLKKLAPGQETVILAPAVMFRKRVR